MDQFDAIKISKQLFCNREHADKPPADRTYLQIM